MHIDVVFHSYDSGFLYWKKCKTERNGCREKRINRENGEKIRYADFLTSFKQQGETIAGIPLTPYSQSHIHGNRRIIARAR